MNIATEHNKLSVNSGSKILENGIKKYFLNDLHFREGTRLVADNILDLFQWKEGKFL
jgi:hypothetical protein